MMQASYSGRCARGWDVKLETDVIAIESGGGDTRKYACPGKGTRPVRQHFCDVFSRVSFEGKSAMKIDS
jgi:hypothetical protein